MAVKPGSAGSLEDIRSHASELRNDRLTVWVQQLHGACRATHGVQMLIQQLVNDTPTSVLGLSRTGSPSFLAFFAGGCAGDTHNARREC